jgi:hypothetical protein
MCKPREGAPCTGKQACRAGPTAARRRQHNKGFSPAQAWVGVHIGLRHELLVSLVLLAGQQALCSLQRQRHAAPRLWAHHPMHLACSRHTLQALFGRRALLCSQAIGVPSLPYLMNVLPSQAV